MNRSPSLCAYSLFALTLLSPAVTEAGTITADGSLCTLADAIRAANTDAASGGCPAGSATDTIQLTADESITLAEASASGSTDTFGGIAGLPDVVSTITIQANGAGDRIERQAGLPCGSGQSDAFRIFNVLSPGNLTLVGITVANGCIAPAATPASGGGFFVASAALALQQSTVTGNTARGYDDQQAAGSVASGGAVYASGSTVTLTTASFTGNRAIGGDGGAAGGLSLAGALYQEGATLTATGTNFSGNSAVGGFGDVGGSAFGGAVFLGTTAVATIGTSSFLGNTAQGGGATNNAGDASGGALITTVSAGIGAFTSSIIADNVAAAGTGINAVTGANAQGGGLHLDGGANGVFEKLIVRSNRAEGGAGSATGGPAVGGGVYLEKLSLAALRASHFVGNIVRGGLANGPAGIGAAATGGGLAVAGALPEISGSTFNGNRSEGGDGVTFAGIASGGGLALQSSSALLVINTTVHANVAQAGTAAGAAQSFAAAGGVSGGGQLLVLRHVTVTANQALSAGASSGGGLDGTFTIDNTVLADNLVTGAPATGPDCSGTVTSFGFNHVEAAAGGCVFAAAGDVVGSDPLLGPFGDHACTPDRVLPGGGCAPTVALLLTSLPLDAGSCTVSSATVDERGFPRPVDIASVANAADSCDKGAFESQGPDVGVDLNITKAGPATNPVVGASFGFVLTVTNQSTISAGTGVTVTDPVPGGLAFVGSTCGATEAGGVVTWTIGTLATEATVSCTLTFQRLAPAAISNQATVAGSEVDPDPADNLATAQLAIAQGAEIPTLSEWTMFLLALSLALLAVSRLRA